MQSTPMISHKSYLLLLTLLYAVYWILLAINGYLQRDFAREWSRILEIKGRRPLGEDEIVRLWQRKR